MHFICRLHFLAQVYSMWNRVNETVQNCVLSAKCRSRNSASNGATINSLNAEDSGVTFNKEVQEEVTTSPIVFHQEPWLHRGRLL